MYQEIVSLEEFNAIKESEEAVLAYFSTDACNVCKVLKPKIEDLLQTRFPKIKMIYVPSDRAPEIAGASQIFVAPTIVLFFHGREYIRKSRNIGLAELEQEISRPYSMAFD